MPSVLIELGYISHRQEGGLPEKRERTNVARDASIYNAFHQYKREHDKKSHVFGTTGNNTSSPAGERRIEPRVLLPV